MGANREEALNRPGEIVPVFEEANQIQVTAIDNDHIPHVIGLVNGGGVYHITYIPTAYHFQHCE